jgi:superfamily I DNA/RNA helicase
MSAMDIDDLRVKLTAWRDREMSAALAEDKEQKAAGIADRAECLFVMMDSLPELTRSVQGLIGRIQSLFQDNEPTLCLSSMHKAKGKEWENVVIYRRELMPSPWARQAWQAKQEKHLDYVARTRTMNLLMWMDEVK